MSKALDPRADIDEFYGEESKWDYYPGEMLPDIWDAECSLKY